MFKPLLEGKIDLNQPISLNLIKQAKSALDRALPETDNRFNAAISFASKISEIAEIKTEIKPEIKMEVDDDPKITQIPKKYSMIRFDY